MTRLFDEWDRPPLPLPEPPKGPLTAAIEGIVFHADTNDPIVGARVSVRTGPNSQQGPIQTDEKGRFRFDHLPAGNLQLMVSANGFVSRTIGVETLLDHAIKEAVGLKPQKKKGGKIRVQGLEVSIADEAIFVIESTGEQLTLEQYRDYTKSRILQSVESRTALRDIWVNSARRRAFLEELRRSSIHPEVLAEVLGQPEADAFDLLCHIAFGDPIRTRSERATAFRNREQAFIAAHKEEARKVILELLDKYRIGGIEQLEPEIFGVSPFREWGGATRISGWFGGAELLGWSLKEMQKRIYAEEVRA
ncbi:MAG: Type I restriction-modification system, restriction subunit R [Hydrogenibacillus schlegelii]|uniref:Type I restriction-modification system, restriction subunit R n=1 Tax=Hydrogenibacillus schlegelii TaxID=1484 RepID=A0A2T5G5V6_HYDSH|nr:type I restriction-modification enzyme R subunit C-terminal domain-containing protein [Hydrogenibacillus schlegelii]PTQ51570.1 MAG: Type I restriction-modification system, restriction subunit R [Hydrogenibacillus schlegelii]